MKKYVLATLMALMVVAQPAQAGPWKEGWKQLKEHFGKAYDRTTKTIGTGEVAGEINEHFKEKKQEKKQEETTIERLEREKQELLERIQREQERETKHICRQCERSVPGR